MKIELENSGKIDISHPTLGLLYQITITQAPCHGNENNFPSSPVEYVVSIYDYNKDKTIEVNILPYVGEEEKMFVESSD